MPDARPTLDNLRAAVERYDRACEAHSDWLREGRWDARDRGEKWSSIKAHTERLKYEVYAAEPEVIRIARAITMKEYQDAMDTK